MGLNSYYYYYLIRPFIPFSNRKICSTRDRHFIANKPRRQRLCAELYLHCGSPCYRYCICKYFDIEDLLSAYYKV